MPSIPELVIIDLFNTLVDRIKQAKPTRTDGKPSGGDIVYSQLLLGMPLDPEDYERPWSPEGGASQATLASSTAGVPVAAGQPNPVLQRALEAAFHTSQLCNIMLQVTNDGSYQEYPVGRHLAFQYDGILTAMTAQPPPPLSAAEQAALNSALNVLYIIDNTDPTNPVIVDKTGAYKRYQKYAQAYADAKAGYTLGEAKAQSDPATAALWPQISVSLQAKVDSAWDDWKTGMTDRIETALATYESQGRSMQQAQIAAAKKQFDVWSLGLAGVPTAIPYSYVDPSEWCDPDNDDIGFEQLQIKRTSQDHVTTSTTDASGGNWWNNSSSSWSQNGHGGFLGIGHASQATSNADQHTANTDTSAYKFTSWKSDHFTDFEVDLEWGLVTIYRPWLISDLFYMNDWYIPAERANCVSDGQVLTQVQSNAPMLPMIPQQMLVVRNVSVKSSTWGDMTDTLNTLYSGDHSQTDASQQAQSGSLGVSLGPISFGGGGSHAASDASGSKTNYSHANSFSRNSASFDGTTLTINGAQIVAFVSDIVPPSPTMDDPSLPKKKGATSTIAGAPAATPASQPAHAG